MTATHNSPEWHGGFGQIRFCLTFALFPFRIDAAEFPRFAMHEFAQYLQPIHMTLLAYWHLYGKVHAKAKVMVPSFRRTNGVMWSAAG